MSKPSGSLSIRAAKFLLGFPDDAAPTEDSVKGAYKKLALLFHPDKNPANSEEAKSKFQNLVEAKNVLTDLCRRGVVVKGGSGSSSSGAGVYNGRGEYFSGSYPGGAAANGFPAGSSNSVWSSYVVPERKHVIYNCGTGT